MVGEGIRLDEHFCRCECTYSGETHGIALYEKLGIMHLHLEFHRVMRCAIGIGRKWGEEKIGEWGRRRRVELGDFIAY